MNDDNDRYYLASDGGADSIDHSPAVGQHGGMGTDTPRENDYSTPKQTTNRDFLLEVVRRAPILTELRGGSATAIELSESVDMSRSTIHRATISLEEHDMIAQSDGAYRLTNTGKIIAETTAEYDERVGTAMALEPFLNIIDIDQIPIEHFVDAKITRPSPRQPHMSIQRIVELIEQSDTLQMLSTVLSPIYVDVGYREMADGMQIEAVFDEEAIEIMISQYADKAAETIETGNFDVYIHDGVPFELFILDDRIGMAAHDEHGIANLLVECDAPGAIEWANDIYDQHLADANALLISDQ